MPIGEAKAKFSGPSGFFEEIVIESHVAAWRDKSFDVVHQIKNAGLLVVEGMETRIWCAPHPDDPKRLKARPVPRAIVEKLSGPPSRLQSGFVDRRPGAGPLGPADPSRL